MTWRDNFEPIKFLGKNLFTYLNLDFYHQQK